MTWLLSWKRVLDVDLEFPADSAAMNIPTLHVGNEDREQ